MSHLTKALVLYLVAAVVAIFSENGLVTEDIRSKCGTRNNSADAITCNIPNQGDKGTCVVLEKCKAYQKVQNFIANLTVERVNFLKHVLCQSETDEIKVCCPMNCLDYVKPEVDFFNRGSSYIASVNSMINVKQKKLKRRIQQIHDIPSNLKNDCGKQISNRIYGGEVAELDEFPWMALIIYNSHEYGCSGVLITKRHVLTAAHCVKGPIVREMKGLKLVRLGEFNTKTQPDCIEERNYLNCADIALDIGIERVLVHPDYNEFSKNKPDDIAVIRLRNPVQITQFIMPICLPDKTLEHPLTPGQIFSVSGWGRTDLFKKYFPNIRSPIKLKLRVPIISQEVCSKTLKPFGFELAPSQICAGGEPSKDTCAGDSGGPLMYFDRNNSRWVTYGIVSYGFTECGLPNHPAVYTSVLDYLDWIMKSLSD